MKIGVVLTVEVDPEAWALEYGTGTTASEVRQDVRDYVLNMVQQCAAAEADAITAARLLGPGKG